jgi:hypothetical protein
MPHSKCSLELFGSGCTAFCSSAWALFSCFSFMYTRHQLLMALRVPAGQFGGVRQIRHARLGLPPIGEQGTKLEERCAFVKLPLAS